MQSDIVKLPHNKQGRGMWARRSNCRKKEEGKERRGREKGKGREAGSG